MAGILALIALVSAAAAAAGYVVASRSQSAKIRRIRRSYENYRCAMLDYSRAKGRYTALQLASGEIALPPEPRPSVIGEELSLDMSVQQVLPDASVELRWTIKKTPCIFWRAQMKAPMDLARQLQRDESVTLSGTITEVSVQRRFHIMLENAALNGWEVTDCQLSKHGH